jgi:hypothetical protein
MQLKAAQIILSCRNIRRAEKGRQRGVWLLDHFVGTQQDGSRDGQGEPLAALRLSTSSNVLGCCTGKSVVLAPLRMRPT